MTRVSGVLLGVVGLIMVGALVVSRPVTREVLRTLSPRAEGEVERFGGTLRVGQTFVLPDRNLVGVTVWLRPPALAAAAPLVLSLTRPGEPSNILREVSLQPEQVTPAGELRARFAPLPEPAGTVLTLTLAAPAAPTGTLAAYREIDGTRYAEGSALRNGIARPGDLEFALTIQKSRGALLFTRAVSWFSALVRAPFAWTFFAVGITVGLIAHRMPRRRGRVIFERLKRRPAVALAVLASAHLLLHIPFVTAYPAVNDEGAYLMDIQNLRAGTWPFRDTLAKGPLFLALLAPVVLASPHDVIPARLFMAVASAIEVFLLFAFLRRFTGGQAPGFTAAILWTLSPAVVAHTTHVSLQPVELLFVTGALIALTRDRSAMPVAGPESWRGRCHPIIAGMLLAAAYLVRASSLAFLPVVLALLWTEWADVKRAGLNTLLLLCGFLGTLSAVGLLILPLLGTARAAVLFNLEAFSIGAARGGPSPAASITLLPAREIFERIAAHGSSLFRSAPLLLILSLGFLADSLRRMFRLPAVIAAAAFAGVIIPLLLRPAAQSYALVAHVRSAAPWYDLLFWAAGVCVVILVVGRERREDSASRARGIGELILVAGSWAALALLYTQFGRFRQQYHAEFLLSYVLGASFFLVSSFFGLRTRWRSAWPVLVGLLAVSLVLTFPVTLRDPHTGSMDLGVARQVAAVIRRHTNPGEEIFTGQALYAFLADRFLVAGASHPGWYLEERVGTITPARRRLFLPDRDALRRKIAEGHVRLVVIERRTREVYLRDDPDLVRLLETTFHRVAQIPEPGESEPVTILVRK